jgi:hypothetical protein
MLRIGFLSRVRGFTYRDDLYHHIIAQDTWSKQPFHFRLYFNSFTANVKGLTAYVLMIDVDRPSIEAAMSFFQEFFDGDSINSPNKIAYLFLPLYRKTYTDNERKSIIEDNDHHTEQTSVVTISGLNNLNNVVQLHQGVSVTIRHLLLAVPAQGTSNGKLFLQIERQASNNWLLCCFNSLDTTKVSLRLAHLETLLKRYITTTEYSKLFAMQEYELKYNGQAAPIKKGRPKLPILEVPESTATYASAAMKKLFTPTQKRLAMEFENTNSISNLSGTAMGQPQTIYPQLCSKTTTSSSGC